MHADARVTLEVSLKQCSFVFCEGIFQKLSVVRARNVPTPSLVTPVVGDRFVRTLDRGWTGSTVRSLASEMDLSVVQRSVFLFCRVFLCRSFFH